jgi:hypothetical protein
MKKKLKFNYSVIFTKRGNIQIQTSNQNACCIVSFSHSVDNSIKMKKNNHFSFVVLLYVCGLGAIIFHSMT